MTIATDNQSEISAVPALVTQTVSPNSPGSNAGAAPFIPKPRKPGRQPHPILAGLIQQCHHCGYEKPLQSFTKSKTNLSGRTSICHTCRFHQRNPDYSKRYRERNRDKAREKQRVIALKRIADRPQKTTCKCGNTDDFSWWRGGWKCGPCSKLKAKETTWKKHQRSRRRIRIKSRAASLQKHGVEVVQAYLALMESGHSLLIEDWQIVRKMLPPDYHHLKRDSIKRIRDMNELSKMPTWNVGWKCSRCPETSFDHRFFDLDHRLPRHKKGSNKKENLQILCPNCHRRKTLCDLWGSGEITPNELGASIPHRVDAASLINTPIAGSPALCGGAGTLVPTAQDSVGISSLKL